MVHTFDAPTAARGRVERAGSGPRWVQRPALAGCAL